MARKPKKPQPPAEGAKNYDEFVEDAEASDDDVPAVDDDSGGVPIKMRDWRDVEKYKEERKLRRLIDDELDFEEPPRAGKRRA
jgi:hypothetical protein